MDRIDKLPGVDPQAGQIISRQTQAAGALLSMKSDTRQAPARTENPSASPQPQDSIELSAGSELQTALAIFNFPQVSAEVPEKIAAALQKLVSETILPEHTEVRSTEPHPTSQASEVAHSSAAQISVQKPTVPVLVPTPVSARPLAQTDRSAPEKIAAGAGAPGTDGVSTQDMGAPRTVPDSADSPGVTSRLPGKQADLQPAAPQTKGSEPAQPMTLAAGWVAVGSNPKMYAHLEVQRDGGGAASPDRLAPPQPHFISLDLFTEHVGVVRVRLSLLQSELVGTLSFSAAAWAAEASRTLPELASALTASGFRTTDLRAIEVES